MKSSLIYKYIGSNVNINKIDYSDFYVYSLKDISEEGEIYDSFNILYRFMWLNEYYRTL